MPNTEMNSHRQFDTPELDEGLWLAWKSRGRERDRARAASRRHLALLLVGAGAMAFAGFRIVMG